MATARGFTSLSEAENHIRSELLSLLLLDDITPMSPHANLAKVHELYLASEIDPSFYMMMLAGGVFGRFRDILERLVETKSSVGLLRSKSVVRSSNHC